MMPIPLTYHKEIENTFHNGLGSFENCIYINNTLPKTLFLQ